MSETSQKMLERVRALLAKADQSEFPAEAESFRAKAQSLMDEWAIAEWMLRQDDPTRATKPERRYIDISWYWRHPQSESLWSLMYSVATHAKAKLVYHDVQQGRVSVLGFGPDLDYFDLLFTSLMLQMNKHVLPEYDPSEELGPNLYRMRSNGMGWPAIASTLYKVDVIDLPRTAPERDSNRREWSWLSPKTQQAMRARLAKIYRDYTHSNGLKQNYTDPKVYQRSYAEGFVTSIESRLYAMRLATQQQAAKAGSDNPYALAVRDTGLVLADYYKDLYAEYLAAQARLAEQMKANRQKSTSKYVADNRVRSYTALAAGGEAGRKADIAGKGEKIGGRKVIGS